MANCEHGGGIYLDAGALCWQCYEKTMGAVYCPRAGQMAMPDKFGCQQWRPAEPSAPMRWCFWCREYRTARWPEPRVTP